MSFVEQRYPKLVETYKALSTITSRDRKTKFATSDWGANLQGDLGIKLVPDLQTAHEARSGAPRSYRLMVRLPNGQTDISPERFTPDQKQAERESAERFRKGNAQTRLASPPDPSSLDGIAASP